jgi:hypothetical protein
MTLANLTLYIGLPARAVHRGLSYLAGESQSRLYNRERSPSRYSMA